MLECLEEPERELLDEFTEVMREWGCEPFTSGNLRPPTLEEAFATLATSPYCN